MVSGNPSNPGAAGQRVESKMSVQSSFITAEGCAGAPCIHLRGVLAGQQSLPPGDMGTNLPWEQGQTCLGSRDSQLAAAGESKGFKRSHKS